MARKKRASYPLLRPKPGTLSIDWSRVDREGPFAWPDRGSVEYVYLAGLLVSLNEVDLSEVFLLERKFNGKSAIHALGEDDLSPEASDRWEQFCGSRSPESDRWRDFEFVTVTYCLAEDVGQRVIVLLDTQSRVCYPLWRDPHHRVSGSNRKKPDSPRPYSDPECFHPPTKESDWPVGSR